MAVNNSPIRAAIFASGNGTNAENIWRFADDNGGIDIVSVVTNKKNAGVIDRMLSHGITCDVLPSASDQEDKILEIMLARKVEWIFLAGYMRLLSPKFISHFPQRIVNIHPSLLPMFAGKDAYHQAWDAGVETSGITLHYVDVGLDTGPIILQQTFPRLPDDDFEAFNARGMALEYDMYREFLSSLVQGEKRWAQRQG